jgi:hypothetical protein
MESVSNNFQSGSAIVSLNRWLEQVGVTPCTAWRWRRKGWLQTINIAGRQYLTGSAIAEFHRRATAGEFAVEHKTPTRKSNFPAGAPSATGEPTINRTVKQKVS